MVIMWFLGGAVIYILPQQIGLQCQLVDLQQVLLMVVLDVMNRKLSAEGSDWALFYMLKA